MRHVFADNNLSTAQIMKSVNDKKRGGGGGGKEVIRKKTLWEMNKLLVTIISSVSQSVFNSLFCHNCSNSGLKLSQTSAGFYVSAVQAF